LIISIDAEKAFDKIQHHFMIKTLRKLGIEGMYLNVGSRLKPMRTVHKQGEMQLIAFTCRPRSAQPSPFPHHEAGKGRTAVSSKLHSERQERRFLLLQCHSPPCGSTLFAAIKDP
jgi:hypothetical protein